VLSRFGEHKGGLIIPGIHSMIRALSLSANNIRLGTAVGEGLIALGHSTGECLRAGALTAIAGSIEFTLRHLTTEAPYTVMLTGGDASTIAAVIEHPARVEPDLVFFGLAEMARAR
jgi:pantothenate kinase type III